MEAKTNDFDRFEEPFFIDRQKRSGVFTMPRNHYHNAYEIYYLLDGERYYFIKDKTYPIMKGDLVLIDMNELHKTINAGSSFDRILINFKSDFLYPVLSEMPKLDLLSFFNQKVNILRLNPDEQDFVRSLLERMLLENQSTGKESLLYAKTLLIQLLIFIYRYVKQNIKIQLDQPNHTYKKVSEIVEFVNLNFSQKITLDILSERFYLSNFYLCRVFKEVTGFNFVEYLNNIRSREACRLLLESDLSVTEISERVGYESITHFGRTFKNIVGVSPTKYRKQNFR